MISLSDLLTLLLVNFTALPKKGGYINLNNLKEIKEMSLY